MRRFILLLITIPCLTLSGCSTIVYKPAVQQGNVVTPKMVDQLRPGMTKEEVKAILGDPMLVDTFDNDRWLYVYTLQPSRGRYKEKRLTLYFKNNKLTHYKGDLPRPRITTRSSRAPRSTFHAIRMEKMAPEEASSY